MKEFPYDRSRKKLIALVEEAAPIESLQKHAEQVVDLHLRPDTLRMPCMGTEDYEDLESALVDGSTTENLASMCKLEETSTKKGMLRVLMRTRMNSSGINDVSKGHVDKTQSPRILGLVDKLAPESPLPPTELADQWLDYAHRHQDQGDKANYYENLVIDTLKLLKQYFDEQIVAGRSRDLPKASEIIEKLKNDKKDYRHNWVHIFMNLVTGWNFLASHNWTAYEDAHTVQGYQEVNDLIKKMANDVQGYAIPLSGSFYADLGGDRFVKDDRHVKASCRALYPELTTGMKRINYIISSGEELGIAPRLIDKIMYIACSGHLYLFGIGLKNSQKCKDEFLTFLREISPRS